MSPIGAGWGEDKINLVFDHSHASPILQILLPNLDLSDYFVGKEHLKVSFLPNSYHYCISKNMIVIFLILLIGRSGGEVNYYLDLVFLVDALLTSVYVLQMF